MNKSFFLKIVLLSAFSLAGALPVYSHQKLLTEFFWESINGYNLQKILKSLWKPILARLMKHVSPDFVGQESIVYLLAFKACKMTSYRLWVVFIIGIMRYALSMLPSKPALTVLTWI